MPIFDVNFWAIVRRRIFVGQSGTLCFRWPKCDVAFLWLKVRCCVSVGDGASYSKACLSISRPHLGTRTQVFYRGHERFRQDRLRIMLYTLCSEVDKARHIPCTTNEFRHHLTESPKVYRFAVARRNIRSMRCRVHPANARHISILVHSPDIIVVNQYESFFSLFSDNV